MRTPEEILSIILKAISSRHMNEKDCLIKSNINTSFLTDWKKGRLKNPSYDKIIKLSQLLDIPLEELFLNKPSTLSVDQKEILSVYDTLDDEGKAIVKATCYKERRRMTKTKNNRM